MWHWDAARHDAALTEDARAAVSAAVAAGVAVQPTLRVVEGEKATLTWDLASVAGLDRVLPATVRRHLLGDAGRWSQRSLADLYRRHNPTPEISPRTLVDASIQRATSSMRLFVRSGGALLLGSDTPAQDGVGNPPGLNTYLEIRSWARAGVPLERIFMAATLGNARAFGLDDEIGSIQPGMRADLALLGANPLVTTDAYNDIRIVILNGAPIDRGSLAAK